VCTIQYCTYTCLLVRTPQRKTSFYELLQPRRPDCH